MSVFSNLLLLTVIFSSSGSYATMTKENVRFLENTQTESETYSFSLKVTEGANGVTLFSEIKVTSTEADGQLPASTDLMVPRNLATAFGQHFCKSRQKGQLADLYSFESLGIQIPEGEANTITPASPSDPVFTLVTATEEVHKGTFQDLMAFFPEALNLLTMSSVTSIETQTIIGVKCSKKVD